MLSTILYIILAICTTIILASIIISLMNRRDFGLISKIFPSYGALFGAIYMKKNPKIARRLLYGSMLGFLYWFFIYDWFTIAFPEFWNSIAGLILIILNPILQGYKGGLSQLSENSEIMGVFWNPVILIFISIGLIVLFESLHVIKITWHKGIPFLRRKIFTPFSLAIISIYPYIIFADGGNVIDIMFAYLIALLIGALSLIIISEILGVIIKLINKGIRYIKQIFILIISFGLISIYPFIFTDNTIDILFAYLYELLSISILLIILASIYNLIIKIKYNGWPYIKRLLLISLSCLVIIIPAYFLADGNIEDGYLRYGISGDTSKLVGTGMLITSFLLFLAVIGMMFESIFESIRNFFS